VRVTEGGLDDPRVRALVMHHHKTARAETAEGCAHALDVESLKTPDIRFFAAWDDDDVVAIGALKRLSDSHGELKSMHTAETNRQRGLGRAMLEHLVAAARAMGMTRLSLETGSWPYFDAARAMYARFGFTECGPFADYTATEHSVYMTRSID
jgi:putative acetyltransferase